MGSGAFRVADDDGAGERRWIWMIGEAACEGILIASTRSNTARIARTFSCRVLRMDGVFRRMLMPETARRAWTAVEKTNEVPLMPWWSTTMCDPAQNPLDEFRPFATELTHRYVNLRCLSHAVSSLTYKPKGGRDIWARYTVP